MSSPLHLAFVLTVSTLTSTVVEAQGTCPASPSVERIGVGSAGTFGTPRLEVDGAAAPGRRLAFDVRGGTPNSLGYLFFGFTPAAITLPNFGALAYMADPSIVSVFTLDDDGQADDLVFVPALPATLCGLEVVAQAVLFDGGAMGNVAFTAASSVGIGAPALGRIDGALALYRVAGNGQPSGLALGDLNGDGFEDVVVPTRFADSFSVWLSQGDGTLGAEAQIGAAPGTYSLGLGDLDADGTLDVVALSRFENRFEVHFGLGDGTFAAPVNYPTGLSPNSVAFGDYDEDGIVDLAVDASTADGITIHLGLGGGVVDAGTFMPVCSRARSVRARDLDADGHLDLACSCRNSGEAAVLLGQGDGTFDAPQILDLNSSFSGLLEVSDYDLDGNLDLGVSATAGTTLFFGAGDGTTWTPTLLSADLGNLVASSDLFGTGAPDLIFSNGAQQGRLRVASNLGNGTFGTPQVMATWRGPVAAGTTDLDGDGRPDLVTACSGSSSIGNGAVNVHLQLDGNAFDAHDLVPTGDAPTAAVVDDFDGDGLLDIAVANAGAHIFGETGSVTLHLARPEGGFDPAAFLQSDTRVTMIRSGRLDAGPTIDLVTADDRAPGVLVQLGTGGGAFGDPVLIDTATPSAIALEDFDGDGILDLAVADANLGRVHMHIGLGIGVYGPPVSLFLPGVAKALETGDLDSNGTIDLVTLYNSTLEVGIHLGVGGGTFTTIASSPLASSATSVAIGDIDGNGTPDLAVARGSLTGAEVLFGLGDGTFSSPSNLGFNLSTGHATLADLNGDDFLDLAIARLLGGVVIVLEGNGNGTFKPPVELMAGGGPRWLELADLNADGLLDFVTTPYGDDEIRITYNGWLR